MLSRLLLLLVLSGMLSTAWAQTASPAAASGARRTDAHVGDEGGVPGVPVILEGREIFYVYAAVGGYSAEERAAHVEGRLLDLAKNRSIPVESIYLQEREAWTEIRAGNVGLIAVTEADARAAGRSRAVLAAEYAEIIRRSVAQYREDYATRNLLRGALYALLATAILVLLLIWLGRLRRWTRRLVDDWIARATAAAGTGSQLAIPARLIGHPLLILGGLLRWFLILALLQVYVTLVLQGFPPTSRVSSSITRWLLSQLADLGTSAIEYLPNLLLVLVILIVTYYIIRLNALFFGEVRDQKLAIRGFYPDWAEPTSRLTRLFILALAAVVAFPYLPGAKSPAFQGISIFLGVLLSLGSTSAVANAVAGTILTYMRSFQVGDWVRIGETTGEVVEKTLLATRVRTPKQEIVTIPNGTAMSASVVNYSAQARSGGVIFHTTVTIGYDAPWRTVHKLLLDAALATQDILREPAPFVLQSALNDFYVTYELNAYTANPIRMQEIYSDLHQNIQDKFNQGGVEIMSPHYSQLRDGNQTTIPGQYLPKDYTPRSFRVQSKSEGEKKG
jgi:small-conductance mechanosensitive channel